MRRIVASLCVCWAAYCAYPPNTAPLAFGMTVEQAALALGVPLVYYAGRGGSEVYVAGGSPAIPGFYPSDVAIALQFRNGPGRIIGPDDGEIGGREQLFGIGAFSRRTTDIQDGFHRGA